ncbi:MAG: DNA-binding protein [Syntrophobacteraceae bacterium]
MKRFKLLLIIMLLAGLVSIAHAQETISSQDAAKFIGQQKTVCGTVGSTHFAPKREGQPTFIDFEKPYPNQVLTALIWGSDRGKFEKPPEMLYSGKEICVTGRIESYEDRPAIVVKDPSQLKVK